MSSRDHVVLARDVAAKIALAGVLAVGAAVGSSATAAADPPPPVPADPAAPAPPPAPAPPTTPGAVGAIVAQDGQQPADPDGPPSARNIMTSILSHAAITPSPDGGPAPDFLLGQHPVPGLPGQPAGLPSVGASTAQSLLPQNFALAGQGQQSFYSTTPADPNAPAGLLEQMKGAHGLWHQAIGQMTPDQLGAPLPGTAPPPGTNMPQGLGPDLSDQPPGAPPAPGAPVAPGAPPGAAPPPAPAPAP